MKLTDIKCKTAKPKDKSYKLFDGGGLYLEVLPTGRKLWRLKYHFAKKEKRISFGAYPITSLSDARMARDDAKRLQLKGIDPSAARMDKKAKIQREAENSFKAVAIEWLENNREKWSEGYAQKIERILEMNLYPHIGNRPIAQIKPPELLDCIRKVEDRKAYDIAAKTKQISGMVFRYGIQTGRCEWNAAENLKGALKAVKTNHFKSLDTDDLPAFLSALERNEARIFERTRRAVWFSLYTFQRPGEIRQAQWSEINWDTKEWRISGEKMKMRRPHIVPLSRQAIAILEEQRKETGYLKTDWVFPSQVQPRNPMSDGTVNKAIKCLGFGKDMVAHGFRALARTTIREKLGYDSEVIEKQLAHKTSNPLGEAYDRTQFLPERQRMMQDWADFIDALASGGKIIKANFEKRRASAA